MRTPAGKECRFYYQDYNRGRNVQECRLIKANPDVAALATEILLRPAPCRTSSTPTPAPTWN